MLKDIVYKRAIPVKFDENVKNYIVDIQFLEQQIEKDVKDGLIPFWYSKFLKQKVWLQPWYNFHLRLRLNR